MVISSVEVQITSFAGSFSRLDRDFVAALRVLAYIPCTPFPRQKLLVILFRLFILITYSSFFLLNVIQCE